MARRPLAIFTIAQEEPETLPKWLAHYSKHVGPHDLYVLHHGLVAGGEPWLDAAVAPYPGVRVVEVDAEYCFDHAWIGETVALFRQFLLQSYEWTLFSDADELLAPMPDVEANLVDHTRRLSAACFVTVRCRGYEVIHQADEPPLRLDEPWLTQRSWWAQSHFYSKSLLSRVPIRHGLGFHNLVGDFVAPFDRLALVHLKKVDVDLALTRHRRYASRDWCPQDVADGIGRHQRIVDPERLRRYFDHAIGPLEPMPDWVRSLA